MKSLLRNIQHAESHEDIFPLELDNKHETLHFVEQHWIDLVTILKDIFDPE